MAKLKIGCYIKIIEMKDEPNYKDKVGKVLFIDDAKQLHGTWGGCAVVPEVDKFEVLPATRNALFEMCEKADTKIDGMNTLIDYYIRCTTMNEKEAVEHATKLFKNGVIRKIEFIFKSDKK